MKETIREGVLRVFSEKHVQYIRGIEYTAIHTSTFVAKILNSNALSVGARMSEMSKKDELVKFPKEVFGGPKGGTMYGPRRNYQK